MDTCDASASCFAASASRDVEWEARDAPVRPSATWSRRKVGYFGPPAPSSQLAIGGVRGRSFRGDLLWEAAGKAPDNSSRAASPAAFSSCWLALLCLIPGAPRRGHTYHKLIATRRFDLLMDRRYTLWANLRRHNSSKYILNTRESPRGDQAPRIRCSLARTSSLYFRPVEKLAEAVA